MKTLQAEDQRRLDAVRQECAVTAHESFKTVALWKSLRLDTRWVRQQAHRVVDAYRFYRHCLTILPLP